MNWQEEFLEEFHKHSDDSSCSLPDQLKCTVAGLDA